MPRNISFSMTTPQFLDGSKDVTRRVGWETLKAGDIIQAVEKAMGLKKGEKIKPLGMIRIIDVRRERLNQMCADLAYGERECVREGFPPPHRYSDPTEFVLWFSDSHRGCYPNKVITRIEFERVTEGDVGGSSK